MANIRIAPQEREAERNAQNEICQRRLKVTFEFAPADLPDDRQRVAFHDTSVFRLANGLVVYALFEFSFSRYWRISIFSSAYVTSLSDNEILRLSGSMLLITAFTGWPFVKVFL